jgi:hypothetical protein
VTRKISKFISAVLISISFTAAYAEVKDLPAKSDLVMGTRIWVSSGETEWSHCASASCGGSTSTVTVGGTSYAYTFGDPTSRLNYSDIKAVSTEVFVNKSLSENLRLFGALGVGNGDGGTFRDQDWVYVPALSRTYEFSDAKSRVKESKVNYLMLDFGRTYSGEVVKITPFLGYMKYREKVSAFGLTYQPDDLGFGGTDLSDVVRVISNTIKWEGFRIGSEFDWTVSEKSNVVMNASYLPHLTGRNEDSHLLRTDLGSSPNIISEGNGDGWMVDLIASHSYSKNIKFEAGYRWWKFKVSNGSTVFGPSFATAFPTRSLYSVRSGLLVGASYQF